MTEEQAEIDFRLGAAEQRDDADAAVFRQTLDVTLHVTAADHVEDDVGAAPLGEFFHLLDKILVIVIDRQRGPKVAAGLALFVAAGGHDYGLPRLAAIMMAAVPIPLLPPWTSSVSPACRPQRSNTLLHTVKKVSGKAAASTTESAAGRGNTCGAGATQYSA